MIKEGIIKKFDTLVDPFKVGYESIAILGLSVDPLRLDDIAVFVANWENKVVDQKILIGKTD